MLDYIDATKLSELIKTKELTPREAIDHFQKNIKDTNKSINAIVLEIEDKDIDSYLQQADREAPFYGVPFGIKDIGIQLKGYPTTASCSYLKDYAATANCALMDRYLGAGLIPIAKTMTPEFGLMGITEPLLYGACKNPWDPSKAAGGSSGGSAAAVASGMLPVAHGTDGGGSIRIPASACGLIGLKPSRGLMANGPYSYNSWYGLVSPHVLARSVRDCASLLDIGQGPELGEPIYGSYKKPGYFKETAQLKNDKFKIAYTEESLLADNNSEEALRALATARSMCQDLGHEMIKIDLKIDKNKLRMAYLTVVGVSLAFEIKRLPEIFHKPFSRKDFEPTTWTLYRFGSLVKGHQLSRAIGDIQAAGYEIDKALEKVDFLITPTTTDVPPDLGLMKLSLLESIGTNALEIARSNKILTEVVKIISKRAFENTGNTQVANMTGVPAISLPLYWTREGLPIGVQFQGKLGQDEKLIQIAAQLEAEFPESNFLSGRAPLRP